MNDQSTNAPFGRRRAQLLALPLALLVILLAAFLRFEALETRPLHFDEGNNARLLATQLDSGSATFNPAHNHGPLLSLVSAPIARLRGESSWQDLSKGSLRIPVAVIGLLTVAGTLFLGRVCHAGGTIAAAAFVATSPLLVYYSRMHIHETLFVGCGLLTLLAFLHTLERPDTTAFVLLGVGGGLMAATRETFVISVFAWALATAAWLIERFPGEAPRALLARARPGLLRDLFLSLALMLFIGLFVYADFGRRPSGILDFLHTFVAYRTESGHEKPFYYFAEMLLWPKQRLGQWWTEGLLLLIALYGYFRYQPGPGRRTCRFLVHSGLVHLLVYSLIGYKTPWLASLGWLHLCLAAGLGSFQAWRAARGLRKGIVLFVLFGVLSWQTLQADRASQRFANDARNPYAYVPTSKDVEKLSVWLSDLREQHPPLRESVLAVVGSYYWPLPWYLRDFDRIGYWKELPEHPDQFPLLLLVLFPGNPNPDSLAETHVLLPRSLRAEVPVMVAIRKDIWAAERGEPHE